MTGSPTLPLTTDLAAIWWLSIGLAGVLLLVLATLMLMELTLLRDVERDARVALESRRRNGQAERRS